MLGVFVQSGINVNIVYIFFNRVFLTDLHPRGVQVTERMSDVCDENIVGFFCFFYGADVL